MKMFVNLIQIMLIAGMVYPVYAMWNNDQLKNFCSELTSNTTKQHVLDLAYEKNIKLSVGNVDDLKWHATASPQARFSDYSCYIKGLGERIASAKMAPN